MNIDISGSLAVISVAPTRPTVTIWKGVQGVQFKVGVQAFTITNTEVDHEDPEQEQHRDFIVKMLEIAFKKLTKVEVLP